MRSLWNRVVRAVASVVVTCASASVVAQANPLDWPETTQQSKPWTRWWWLGSAVDKPNLTRLLTEYEKAGLGGVEICPIYGAKGHEARYLPFLSPQWMEALAHTTTEGKRLGIGVDLTTGTGWPFGGPWIDETHASAKVTLKAYDVAGGATLNEKLPAGELQCLLAVSDSKERVDLTKLVKEGKLEWTAPAGKWRLYAAVQNAPVQKVKRAAPGGEGNVVDPYSVASLEHYLAPFEKAFAEFEAPKPRGHFHDSFEYYGATWADDLFDEFKKRRGYELREQLPALFSEGEAETVARVKHDYRETLSDLHLEYVKRWVNWAHSHGGVARNQSHGAPANLIDLYAAADIPETEIFNQYDETHLPMLKLASSGAHLTGKKLVSAESFTWLQEHFQVALADVKPAADYLFLAGLNHLFYHGVPYSPEDVEWPGWLFYASVHFGPQGGLWHDLPALNAYIARCQSVLQSGKPDNDVLLYVPFHEVWQDPRGMVVQFTTPGKWMNEYAFHATAMKLWERGYAYDLISDQLLSGATASKKGITVGGNTYRVILVPKTPVIPLATLEKLLGLARAGATVCFESAIPTDVPGFGKDEQRDRVKKLVADVGGPVICDNVGEGFVRVVDDVQTLMSQTDAARETMAGMGLRFVRRTHERGRHYFVVYRGEKVIDGWVPLAVNAASVAILDPRFADRAGMAAARKNAGGGTEVYLQLRPGDSVILRTFDAAVEGPAWAYAQAAGEAVSLAGKWKVEFVEGGPKLPRNYETETLTSWTTREDAEAQRFNGTARYTLEFEHVPARGAAEYLLDLGNIADSARVLLNGEEVAHFWCRPFQVEVGKKLRAGKNVLQVDVTNVAANRVRDLDRRGVSWKSFHEINFVNLAYKPFDASNWPVREAGLLGPVRIVPLKTIDPIHAK